MECIFAWSTKADALRAEYAQSWRRSDVELGVKPKRLPVSQAAADALEKTFGDSVCIDASVENCEGLKPLVQAAAKLHLGARTWHQGEGEAQASAWEDFSSSWIRCMRSLICCCGPRDKGPK